MRDSKAPEAGYLAVSYKGFAQLIDRLRRGDLDL
jgi:hypothetical protein